MCIFFTSTDYSLRFLSGSNSLLDCVNMKHYIACSDSQFRTRWRSLAWHPAVATQLCIASEDDQTPVIQLWDLRCVGNTEFYCNGL